MTNQSTTKPTALTLSNNVQPFGIKSEIANLLIAKDFQTTLAPNNLKTNMVSALFNFEQTDIGRVSYGPDTSFIERHLSSLKNSISPSITPAIKSVSIEEQVFDATSTVKILTSQVAMYLNPEQRTRLFKQIDSLHDIDEWEPGDKPIQQQSFNTFIKTILHIKPNRQPSLGLSHNGNLLAAWINNPNRLIVEFLVNNQVKWSIVKSLDGLIEKSSGQTTISRLVPCLSPYEPSTWFE